MPGSTFPGELRDAAGAVGWGGAALAPPDPCHEIHEEPFASGTTSLTVPSTTNSWRLAPSARIVPWLAFPEIALWLPRLAR